MSIFDKLMFWKSNDKMPDMGSFDAGFGKDIGGLGLDNNPGLGSSDPGFPDIAQPNEFGQNAPFGQPRQQFAQPRQQYAQPQMAPQGFQAAAPPPFVQQSTQQEFTIVSKDIELLSYKLDTLKASLDMVNQRLANIERLATPDTPQRRSW